MRLFLLALIAIVLSATPSWSKSCHGASINIGPNESGAYYDRIRHSIHISTSFLSNFSPKDRQFVIAHECTHAAGIYNERAADRRAAKVTKKLLPSIINELCAYFIANRDPARCRLLKKQL